MNLPVTDRNHQDGDQSSAPVREVSNVDKGPQRSSGPRREPASLQETTPPLASLFRHFVAWRAALQSALPTPVGRWQGMRLRVRAWAIALSLSSARVLLGKVAGALPPQLRAAFPSSIHLLDSRGPAPALRSWASLGQQRERDEQSSATAATGPDLESPPLL